MIHGLSTRAFIENGPAGQTLRSQATRSDSRGWRALEADCRLALVERALKPANDLHDAYPAAL